MFSPMCHRPQQLIILSVSKTHTCGPHSMFNCNFPKTFSPLAVEGAFVVCLFGFFAKHDNPTEQDWINSSSCLGSTHFSHVCSLGGGASGTGSGWVGVRVPCISVPASKLRPAASFRLLPLLLSLSPSTVLSNQSAVRPSADAPPHVQV